MNFSVIELILAMKVLV